MNEWLFIFFKVYGGNVVVFLFWSIIYGFCWEDVRFVSRCYGGSWFLEVILKDLFFLYLVCFLGNSREKEVKGFEGWCMLSLFLRVF